MQRYVYIGVVVVMAFICLTTAAPTTEQVIQDFKARFETLMKRPNLVQGKRFNTPPRANTCGYKEGKYSWDLEPLKSATDLEGTDADHPDFTYKMSVCGSVTSMEKCSASVCQFISTQEEDNTFALGYFNKGEPAYSMVDASDLSKGVRMTLNNGDNCEDQTTGVFGPRTVHIDFGCSSLISPSFAVTQTGDCVYNVKYDSPQGCYKESVDPNPNPNPTNDEGLSGGTIFLILVIVVSFVYVVGGCLFNYFKNGLRGLDACPQKEFWFGLPGLVRDGCAFTFGKIRSLCTKTETTTSGEYETTI